MRYRRPYAARHTSVSWNLMVGRNALLVAKEHGHRPLTMLTVYAAWTEGAPETIFARFGPRAIRKSGKRCVRPHLAPNSAPAATGNRKSP
jgi:hypothetical protein